MINQKKLAILLVPVLILTVLWVIFNIYHNHVTSTVKAPLNQQIAPIEGTFNTETIDKIKERRRVEPINEIATPEQEEETLSPSPTPEIAEEETGTESAETEPEELETPEEE
jgi:hypothetical protein